MKIYIFLTLALLSFSVQNLHSQIVDNFSDGNFDQNPTWVGDATNFIVNPAGELQLNASAAGTSALLVAGNIPDSTVWDFEVRLAFSPSNQNLVRIFLQIDRTDLASANGYFLEMGETGSLDAIRFFRQDGATKILMATGQPGLAATSPHLHIRVKRSISGDWTLEAATIGTALQPQFALTENTWPGGPDRFFGFQCVYTISNAARFYFDNINIRPDVPDTQAPVLLLANGDDLLQISAVFDEDLDIVSAEDPAHYSVNNGIGQPLSATLAANKKTVVLTLQNQLSTGNYTLQTTGIQDISGNESAIQTADFQFIKIEVAEEFDILINEIMADPTPSRGLPELEWVEIFNRSNKVFDLSNFRFADATSSAFPLPAYALQPGAYAVLTANANVAAIQGAATNNNVLGIGMSSTALNNDGDVLTLSDASGKIIDRVSYGGGCNASSSDYDGVSRERINPELPCLGLENWQPSPALIGATLGFQNASYATTPDFSVPTLLYAYPESPSSILLQFDKGLDKFSVQNPAAYRFSPPRVINAAEQLSDDRARVRLTLSEPLEPATLYIITLGNDISDCSGNLTENIDTTYVGLPEKPEYQDIILSEILFNPYTGGARYLEYYNRSQKIFDWSEFFLADTSGTVAITPKRLFFPGIYQVLSPNPSDIRSRHENIYPGRILCQNLPSLNDNEDLILLYWAGSGLTITMDSFYYRKGMHNALLTTSEQDGVALERIRLDGPTQSASNWTSASSLITGSPGTPTLPNSQAARSTNPTDDLISIPVSRLSPDGDAYEDYLEIFYKLPKEGYAASLTIFDSDGNLIKTLLRQNLAGVEGSFRWDGDTDAGEGIKTRPGIHLLYFEIYSPDGDVRRVKKAVAVIGRY